MRLSGSIKYGQSSRFAAAAVTGTIPGKIQKTDEEKLGRVSVPSEEQD